LNYKNLAAEEREAGARDDRGLRFRVYILPLLSENSAIMPLAWGNLNWSRAVIVGSYVGFAIHTTKRIITRLKFGA
jgi:hypothetical protein